MDTRTGKLSDMSLVESLSPDEQKHFVEVKRELTELEKMNHQIMLYSPCGCGSGKKFKFCCYKKSP